MRLQIIVVSLSLIFGGVFGFSEAQQVEPNLIPSTSEDLLLQQAERIQMLQLQPGDFRPYFRVDLNLVDRFGALRSIDLPTDKEKQRDSVIIVQDGNKFHPFYLSGSNSADLITRELILVIDSSGSMLEKISGENVTRFKAAKAAAKKVIQEFQDGVDSVAIVPFESRQVKQGIRNAQFVRKKEEARQLIDNLPQPDPKGNTGLYSAALEAMEVMRDRKVQDPSRQYQLILLTDGKNDVNQSGDDSDLLDGEEGLSLVEAKREAVGVEVFTIGFGEKRKVNEEALIRIASHSSNYSLARNAEQLKQVLKKVRRAMVNRLRVTFCTDVENWRELPGLTFQILLKLQNGQWVKSNAIEWSCSPLTACSPEGILTVSENRERLNAKLCGATGPVVGRFLVIFAAFSVILALLWFGLPRLIWPGSKPPGPTLRKPSPKAKPKSAEPKHQPPPSEPRKPTEWTVRFKNPKNGKDQKK